jgi:hypothetical protein
MMATIVLTADDLGDLSEGASINTIAADGQEVVIYPPDHPEAN